MCVNPHDDATDREPVGRTCVWCGQRPVTREHLVAQWLGRLIAATWPHPDGCRQWTRFTGPDKAQRENAFRKNTLEVVVRAVCARCNNGWMSQLEARTQPTLRRLICGEVHQLTPTAQAAVALWCAKFTALMNAYEPNAVVHDEDDLESISIDGHAPAGQLIRIAYVAYPAQTPLVLNVTTGHIIPIEEAEAGGQLRTGPPNGYLATVAFGHFAFCVAGGPAFRNISRWRRPPTYPMTIWPPAPKPHRWPPEQPRIEDHTDLIAFHEAVYPAPEERQRLLRNQGST